ncbi:MAG: hypothetical protein ACR652_23115 [Methylocystis sp.]|uniref:hypothetical protein n=1 Tax=Methylocystis sp. TaxID=1911079 RepID=UPI003DA2DC33
MNAPAIMTAPPIRWAMLNKAQRSAWLDVLEKLAEAERLPRRAVAALDIALDLDADRKAIPPHVAAALERAIVDARTFLGL